MPEIKTCKRGHPRESGSCKICAKSASLMRTYGLTVDEYIALWHYQDGKCGICHKPIRIAVGNIVFGEGGLRTEVDHTHIVGKDKFSTSKKSTVRGLLCGGRYLGCNKRLGRVDKAEWLGNAAQYMHSPPGNMLILQDDDPCPKPKKKRRKRILSKR